MVRRAWVLSPSAETADILAWLLYVTGEVVEAIAMERLAVERVDPTMAAGYREALGRMEAGQELGDRPGFELYPEVFAEPVDPSVSVVS
jgi:hypothetical protein